MYRWPHCRMPYKYKYQPRGDAYVAKIVTVDFVCILKYLEYGPVVRIALAAIFTHLRHSTYLDHCGTCSSFELNLQNIEVMFSAADTVLDTMGVLSLKTEIGAPDDESDNDTIDEETLNRLFEKGELLAEKLISTNSYVLHLDGTK